MIQCYPFFSGKSRCCSVHSVFRPRLNGKLLKQKILSRNKDMHLIPEVGFKWPAPVGQAGTVCHDHLMLLLSRVTGPEVVPRTKADCVGVLV